MKIAIIGSGYVGLVSGACLSELGFNVVCVDVDEEKIEKLNKGEIPIYEPGLQDLILKNKERLTFTTNLKSAMHEANVVMIAVGTPSRFEDGEADLTYVFKAAEDIAKNLMPYQVILTKSTVPVGTGQNIKDIIQKQRPDLILHKDYDVASNPEFLREGSAIGDFMNPDRVVIGVDNETSKEVLFNLYKPLKDKGFPVFDTNIQTAELIKYAANGFLAMKIAFINQVSDLCEAVDANITHVSKGIGLDKRIGEQFLQPGPGYGGSCFPKDTTALAYTGQKHGCTLDIIEAVIDANNKRKEQLAARLIHYFKKNPDKKRIAILGVTFKANTDDLRKASSLVIVPALINAGIEVVIYDPIYHKGSSHTQTIAEFKKAIWAENLNDAINGADGVCILTEWDEFKNLDWTKLKEKMKEPKPLIADYRNLYSNEELNGFYYMSLGRKDICVD